MKYRHKLLAAGKWKELSFIEQMANIGSEVIRTINWKKKNKDYSKLAFYRALELADLTIADRKNKNRLKEIVRMREILVDYFFGENIYESSDKLWEKYFLAFNWKAQLHKNTQGACLPAGRSRE